MTERNDGGWVFPIQDMARPNAPGMTLRDWFAGQALRLFWSSGRSMAADDVASVAYEVADAMIAARDAE